MLRVAAMVAHSPRVGFSQRTESIKTPIVEVMTKAGIIRMGPCLWSAYCKGLKLA